MVGMTTAAIVAATVVHVAPRRMRRMYGMSEIKWLFEKMLLSCVVTRFVFDVQVVVVCVVRGGLRTPASVMIR